MDRAFYWRRQLRRTAILLTIWAVVGFGCSILFVEWLNQFQILGMPLGFWMAQQGSIYVFVLLIFFYAWRMNRIDEQHDVHED